MGVAHALELPHRLTKDVEMKVPTLAVVELHFDFKLNAIVGNR